MLGQGSRPGYSGRSVSWSIHKWSVLAVQGLLVIGLLHGGPVGAQPSDTTSVASEAEQREAAQKYFEAGLSFQKLEDFEAAIAQYQESLRLYPTKSAMFNLGNSQRAAHHYAEALSTLERLQATYPELAEPMRGATERQLLELRALTGPLSIEVLVDGVPAQGVQVMLDGAEIGTTPIDPWRVDLGKHEVVATKQGFQPARQQVVVKSPQGLSVQLALVVEPPPKPEPASPPVAPIETPAPAEPDPIVDTGPGSQATVGWVAVGVGGALLLGGAVTGAMALSVDSDLADACVDGSCPPAKRSDVDKLDTLAVTTDVLLGVGAAVAITGGVLLLLDADSADPVARRPAVDLALSTNSVGINWCGDF